MPVTPPSSGSIITTASITNMHATVRQLINDLAPRHVGRGSFGTPQLGHGIVVGTDHRGSGPENLITYPVPFVESAAAIIATWQDLVNWNLDNGGVGYVLPPCLLIMSAVIHLDTFDPAVSFNNNNMGFFNLYHVADAVDQTRYLDSRCVFADNDRTTPAAQWHENWQTVNIVRMVDYSAKPGNWTLNRVGVRAALCQGSSVHTPALTLYNGQVSFIAVHPQS